MNGPHFRIPRGTRAASKPKRNLVCIEGEYVTLDEIGSRLGITAHSAGKRLAKARDAAGPITWASLGLKESPR